MREGIFQHWPNRITAARFVGAAVLFVVLSQFTNSTGDALAAARRPMQLSFWLFILIAASDVLDGWLARRGNHITAFGRIADPFVDKVMILGAMIYLAVCPWSQPWFPAWVVVVILAREFLVTGLRGYVESLGEQFPADALGKVKMFTQCFAVGIVLGIYAFEWSPQWMEVLGTLAQIFVWSTVVTSVGSGVNYVLKTRRILAGQAG